MQAAPPAPRLITGRRRHFWVSTPYGPFLPNLHRAALRRLQATRCRQRNFTRSQSYQASVPPGFSDAAPRFSLATEGSGISEASSGAVGFGCICCGHPPPYRRRRPDAISQDGQAHGAWAGEQARSRRRSLIRSMKRLSIHPSVRRSQGGGALSTSWENSPRAGFGRSQAPLVTWVVFAMGG